MTRADLDIFTFMVLVLIIASLEMAWVGTNDRTVAAAEAPWSSLRMNAGQRNTTAPYPRHKYSDRSTEYGVNG